MFLDEIGDMTSDTQAKILRLLQEGSFERVGGSESIVANVHILAATNQHLDTLIAQGKFRKDLYYRLRSVTIQLPRLSERREDIAELAHYFLFRFNRQLGTAIQSIAPEALLLLENHDWPGNVRELQNAIREALIVSAGSTLRAEFLPAELREKSAGEPERDAMPQDLPAVEQGALAEFVASSLARRYRSLSPSVGALRPLPRFQRFAAHARTTEPGRRDPGHQSRNTAFQAPSDATHTGESAGQPRARAGRLTGPLQQVEPSVRSLSPKP